MAAMFCKRTPRSGALQRSFLFVAGRLERQGLLQVVDERGRLVLLFVPTHPRLTEGRQKQFDMFLISQREHQLLFFRAHADGVIGNAKLLHRPRERDRRLLLFHEAVPRHSVSMSAPTSSSSTKRVPVLAAPIKARVAKWLMCLGMPALTSCRRDRKSTRLNSSHVASPYADFSSE